MIDEGLYAKTFSELKKWVTQQGLGGSDNLQIAGVAEMYDTSTPAAGILMPTSTYYKASVMPQWSAVSAFEPNLERFFDAYRSVLSLVSFEMSPSAVKQQQNIQSRINDLFRNLNEAKISQTNAYTSEKENTNEEIWKATYPNGFPDWAKVNSSFQNQINNINSQIKAVQDQLDTLIKANASDELKRAREKLDPPEGTPASGKGKQGWGKIIDGNGNMVWVPEFIVDTGKALNNAMAAIEKGNKVNPLEISVSQADANENFKRGWAQGTAEYNYFIYKVIAGASWQNQDLTQTQDNISITMRTEATVAVNVTPGEWYDGGFVRNLINNQGRGAGYHILEGWKVKGEGGNVVFGKGGILQLAITKLIFAIKPSIEIKTSDSYFKDHFEEWKASGGVSIGPFTIGGAGGQTKNFTVTKTSNNSAKFETTSNDPLVIAVLVAEPGS
jgi:hypothetical protein